MLEGEAVNAGFYTTCCLTRFASEGFFTKEQAKVPGLSGLHGGLQHLLALKEQTLHSDTMTRNWLTFKFLLLPGQKKGKGFVAPL